MVLADCNILKRLHQVKEFKDEYVFPAIENKKIVLDPLPSKEDLEKRLGPCSIDILLGSTITEILPPLDGMPINPLDPEDIKRVRYIEHNLSKQSFVLRSGQFVLGVTYELIGMPIDTVCFIADKSRLARLGVTVCLNSPKIDPGFHGAIALEINNRGPLDIVLSYKMPICQFIFHMLAANPVVPYHKRHCSTWSGQLSATKKSL